ncbi:hypothetical protein GCM10027567_03230 [Spongiibacter taiwanensis]
MATLPNLGSGGWELCRDATGQSAWWLTHFQPALRRRKHNDNANKMGFVTRPDGRTDTDRLHQSG